MKAITQELKELIEASKMTPVIDRTYPLSETALALGQAAAVPATAPIAVAS